ncbi:zinc ribbon domain-containing protein [Bacillus cereus]|uniref:zinc ribbon domain-containing protein n=1 Tax=Bacillus cereus TaxID=1396 RepID=UPI001879DFE2|nr:zinc ribbon domain-containing protein [Bacillus cereus]MBE7122936.1 zinc-ribbon domain-containing protein [Bacillus cereus]
MKYCSHCGNESDDGNKFCGNCGEVFVQREKIKKDNNEKIMEEKKVYKKKWKFSFTKKHVVFLSILGILMISIFMVKYNHEKRIDKEKIANGQEFLRNTRIKVLEDSMDSYENKDTGFLKEYIDERDRSDFYQMEDELDSIIHNSLPYMITKDDEINKQVKDINKRAKVLKDWYNRINEKIEIQRRVNHLYLQVNDHRTGQLQYITIAINGDRVSYNLPLNENLKEYDFNQAKKDYVEEKDGKKLSQWQKAINKLITNAETQYKSVHGVSQSNNKDKAITYDGGAESDRPANAGEDAGKVSSSISKLTNQFVGEWVDKDSPEGHNSRGFSYTKDSRHIKFNDEVEAIDVAIVSAEKNAEGNVVIKVYDPNFGTDYKTLTLKYKDKNTMLFMNDSAYDPLGKGFRTFVRK